MRRAEAGGARGRGARRGGLGAFAGLGGLVALSSFIGLAGLGCRERVMGGDAAPAGDGGAAAGTGSAAPAPPPTVAAAPAAEPRLVYPAGSFVEVVGGARMAVVALRARAPVKGGPAAMLPGTPDAVADVALGTGFLV